MGNPTGIGGWKKGQSGNPAGSRPRSQVQFVERLKETHAPEAEARLLEAVQKKEPEPWAVQLVLAYSYGKPSDRAPSLEDFSVEQLEAELERRLIESAPVGIPAITDALAALKGH